MEAVRVPQSNNNPPRSADCRVGDVLAAERLSGPEVRASSCSSSAELVQPGDLYFAINRDPALTAVAARRGAAAVVTDTDLEADGATVYRVADVRAALAEFCQTLVGRPSLETGLIGVAGTDSAASITRLVSPVLATPDKPVAWWDARWVCDAQSPPSDTGAEATPPLVASWLSRSVAAGCRHAVAALTPGALENRAFASCGFQVVCLTEDACSADAAGTTQEKRDRLAELASRLRPAGVLVVDAADPIACRIAAESPQRLLTYGLKHAADVTGEVIEHHSGGQTLLVRWGDESAALETPVPGNAHANNCLAAVAIGLACGRSLQTIVKGVESAPRPPGVLEPVAFGQDFGVFLDEAKHADRLRSAASAVRQAATGRVLTIVSGDAGQQMLRAAAAKSDLVIAASEPPPGFAERPEFRFVDESFAAVALGVALAERGDAVLISGVEVDRDGRCPVSETVRDLIALRNQHTPPIGWAA